MTDRTVGRFAIVTALGVAAGTLQASLAHAEEPTVDQCIAASDHGLDLRKKGKLLEARRELVTCANAACGEAISRVCTTRLRDVQTALPTIAFAVKDSAGNDVAGVRVTVDGGEPAPVDGRAIALDPGAHTFRFEPPTGAPVSRSFILVEGVKGREEAISIGGAPTVTPRASGSGARTAAYVLGGVGVLGLATGAVFGWLTIQAKSDEYAVCGGNISSCSNPNAGHHEAVKGMTSSIVADAAAGVGAAALVTGIVLFLTSGHATAEHPASASIRVAPRFGTSYAGLSVGADFR